MQRVHCAQTMNNSTAMLYASLPRGGAHDEVRLRTKHTTKHLAHSALHFRLGIGFGFRGCCPCSDYRKKVDIRQAACLVNEALSFFLF